MTAASICVPSESQSPPGLFKRLSKISKCILPKVLSNCYFWLGYYSVWDFGSAPFKSGVFISLSFLALPKANPTGFSSILMAYISHVRSLVWEAQCRTWTPCSLRRSSAIVFSLPFVGCSHRLLVLTSPHVYPS